jgi:hypothetical protein
VEADLLSARETLETEWREHSKVQTSIGLVCNAFKLGQTGPELSSLRSRLAIAFERARTLVRESLNLGVRRAFVVFRSHYVGIDLVALSEGYTDAPEAVLDAIDEEVVASAMTLASNFEDEIVPPPRDM